MRTEEAVREFVASIRVGETAEAFTSSDLLIEEGIIDSFGIMRLLDFLEQQFSITIEGDELLPENFESVNAICSLIERKLPKNAGDG